MNKYITIIIGALFLIACKTDMVYNKYVPIEGHEWNSANKMEFIVNNLDTISNKNVFINIRSNKNYEFSSLFLIAKIEFPNGFHVIDTLEYEMTDSTGNWLGTGYTELKENKLFYKQNVVFSEVGDYKFKIQHATRSITDIEGKNPLKGITDVGLSIENAK
tara:strand:+ start:1218 stop:1700 length:483 start_codon:yes stop_codon:yes gene_type:complete